MSNLEQPFQRDEYNRRLEAVRGEMERRGAELLIVDETEHLAYLTGFGPAATMYQACLVPLAGDPVMVLRHLDEPSFVERSWVKHTVTFSDAEDPVTVVAKTIDESGWAGAPIAIALDSHYLPVQRYRALVGALPDAPVVDFAGVLWELRLIKSSTEVDYLRRAAQIADAAMDRAVAQVHAGKSERTATAVASSAFIELGADGGHIGRIASGGRSNSLHGALGDHRLSVGDVVHMELCPQVHGYSARLMRPTVVGRPSDELAAAAQELIEIQDAQLAAMHPGARACDVDRICRNEVLRRGLRDSYDNATGYTLGYYGTPYPPRSSDFTRVFLPSSQWELAPGMVFHMYTSARGMAFSETVLVTDGGSERLTRSDRRLFHSA